MSMKQRLAAATILLAGGALAGGLVAGSLSADAATGPGSGTAVNPASDHDAGRGHAGETTVTGSKATTLKAAALKAVPGATVDRIETDSGDAAYEVHMTKSDGSQVTVKFTSSLSQSGIESGMGK